MRFRILAIVFIFLCLSTIAQKTLLLEKIGTSRKFYYHLENKIKLRTTDNRMVIGNLMLITDSTIFVTSERYATPLKDIVSIYPQFGFPKRLGKKLCIASGVFFLIFTFNNLVNNQQVFPSYGFIFSAACLAGGLISLSLAQQKCTIGYHWKLKILGFTLH